MSAAGVQVEIWSDLICPWCYIGKRRFEEALARFEHRHEVAVTWRSFELDPAASAEPIALVERLAAKFGVTGEQATEMNARMTETAAGVGLRYDLAGALSGSTFDGHQLLHLAREAGREEEAVERLMAGYFAEGRPISDRDALVELAAEAGLDPADARAALDEGRYADAVRRDERTAAELGISGVPFFVLDRRLGVSGAQPAEVLLGALERAHAERQPV